MYGTFTHTDYKNQVNVGKYTSPMDPMGSITDQKTRHIWIFSVEFLVPDSRHKKHLFVGIVVGPVKLNPFAFQNLDLLKFCLEKSKGDSPKWCFYRDLPLNKVNKSS